MNKKNLKISFNSPVILTFTGLCVVSLILNMVTNGMSNQYIFSTYRSSIINPMTYVRLVLHVVGHQDFTHFLGNMTLLLLIGPMLEEKYGKSNIIFIILSTAIITGILKALFFPNVALLGASGIVFAFIILSSMTSIKDGSIPLTFILIVMLYIGKEVYNGIFIHDNISNFTHIIGGIVGAGCGFLLNKNKRRL